MCNFYGQGLTEAERLENVHLAAEAAQLGDTIRDSLPNGLDTTIGERSEHDLSDGQTQRLAIARCAIAITDADVVGTGTAVELLLLTPFAANWHLTVVLIPRVVG